jgi:hypothetical protein
MSTFYFGDGVCNQHTHTHGGSAPGSEHGLVNFSAFK